MDRPLPVSIIINNYNYGRFLKQAIDSALNQNYRPVEVIVVDDGSTDHSREIMLGYGQRIKPLFKENGGQASAFNAGFLQSQGDVVIFLDADDMLAPTLVERVVSCFRANPKVAKVQYRLEEIDAAGRPTGALVLPAHQRLLSGDLRQHVLAFPDDIPWLPTSGNAFAAHVLRRFFPVPEEDYRICADYYLSNLSPLFGPVISLDEVGGSYRIHGSNYHHKPNVNLEQTRAIITRTRRTHQYIREVSGSLGFVIAPAKKVDIRSVTFLAHRMVSLKLDPLHHPIREDKIISLAVQGMIAAAHRFDLSLPLKCIYLLWFGVMALAPRSLARRLAQLFFHMNSNEKLHRLLAAFRREGGRRNRERGASAHNLAAR